MKTVIIEDNGKWWKFVVPASAGGEMGFFEAGYSGRFYGVQPYKDGEVTERVDGMGMGPDHEQRSGVLPVAYLWFMDETVVKGKEVKMA